MLARAIQHETDHLDGIIFVDRLDREARKRGDEVHPRVGVVRRAAPAGEALPARHQRPRDLTGCASSSPAPPRSPYPHWRRSPPAGTSSSAWSPGPTRPAGRGRRLVASPVALRAEELGVPVLKPDHPRDPDFQDGAAGAAARTAARWSPTARCCRSRPSTSPSTAGSTCTSRCCPSWRGAAPVQHAIWAGDEVTGATTFRIVKELDAGPTFGLMTQTIRPDDTAGDLLARLAEGGAGPARADPRRHRGRHPRGARAARRRGSASPPRSPSRTPGSTGPSRPSRSTAGSVPCTPAPGAWSTFAGSGSSSVRCGRVGRERARAGLPRGDQERRLRRHRHRTRSSSAGSSRSARRRWTRPTGRAACSLEPVPVLGE